MKNDFSRFNLKNGATLLFERRNLPIISIVAATKAGAAYEKTTHKGIAHFTEHMLFKGSKKRNQKEIAETIEKKGGQMNGFTSEQITAFYCKIPSNKFLVGADVIFDMVANPKFDAKEIEKEKGVILSEISRAHDLPQYWLFDKVKELLYEKPFALPILGLKYNIENFKKQNFFDWHRNYGAENLIISIVGKGEIEEIKRMAEKTFMQKKTYLPKVNPILKNKNCELVEKRKNLDQAHLALAFKVPTLSNREKYATDVFNVIFGQGMSSWLHQEIREKRGWAYSIASFIENEKNYGHCVVYAGIRKENTKKVKNLILKQLNKFKDINAREIEEAKEQCIGQWQLGLEDSEKTATELVIQEIACKAEEFYKYPELISKVKIEEVKNIAKIKNYVVAVLLPD